MAPLAKALQVSFQGENEDGIFSYLCELDPTWAIGAVPQGGYSLGVIVEACIQHQTGSSHSDPIHVSAHFLRATNSGVGQVHIKPLKCGKTFTDLEAQLIQQGTTRISAHLIFGDLSPVQPGREQQVLAPPSPYARRLPLHSHPSTATCDVNRLLWMKNMRTQIAVDAVLLSHNDPRSPTRTTPESVGGGGVEWGAWYELTEEGDKLTTSSIPFFCDTFVNLPSLLPENELGSTAGNNRSWYPTIAMTIEFKARIPASDNYSARTVALYSEARFMTNPERRHDARVEVWTAPSQIGQGGITLGWRDHQYCIAVADHVALVLPGELNIRLGTKDAAKL